MRTSVVATRDMVLCDDLYNDDNGLQKVRPDSESEEAPSPEPGPGGSGSEALSPVWRPGDRRQPVLRHSRCWMYLLFRSGLNH